MKVILTLPAVLLIAAVLASGTTPIAPAGPAHAAKCSKAKCLANCGGKYQSCSMRCNFCDRP
jgi:hypothetical protein